MKPAESISQHAIRNASTAKKGLIKRGLFLNFILYDPAKHQSFVSKKNTFSSLFLHDNVMT